MVIRGAAYDRQPRDLYRTPCAVTAALLDHVSFAPVLCDPCCGYGDMLAVFRARGYRALGCDIQPVAAGARVADFLADPFPFAPCDIVTNPPSGPGGRVAVAFIERALAITQPWQGKVAMLTRRDFDSAPGRVHLFRDHPAFATTVVLLGRITWFAPRVASPAENHCWCVWDWRHRGRPQNLYAELGRHQGFAGSATPVSMAAE
jgi:SAM-dependent methyltransferase